MSQQSRIASLITAIGADIKSLTTSLAGKANVSHTHTVSQITDIGPQIHKGTSAPADTTKIWVDITGL